MFWRYVGDMFNVYANKYVNPHTFESVFETIFNSDLI